MSIEDINNTEPIKEFVASKQSWLFKNLKQSQFSGQLLLTNSQAKNWFFYLYLGRVIYATGGIHPVRRFIRNMAAYLPQMVSEFSTLEKNPELLDTFKSKISWEYDLLSLWREQEKITREQVNKMVFSLVVEILFDLTQQGKQVTFQLKPDKSISNPLALVDADQAIVSAWMLWQDWQRAKVADRSPNNSPIITQPEQLRLRTSEKTFQIMNKILDGKRSMRDIALQLQQDVVQITTFLMPYIQLGLIELVEILDLKSPKRPPKITKPKAPLIACVDDSPLICQTVEHIVTNAGYQFLAINDDLRAISTILNLKPDLIILDLFMPHINGDDICAQLRKIPEFQNTPIFLINDNWSIITRMRTKMTGYSELLTKPIDPQELLNVITRYLQQQPIN